MKTAIILSSLTLTATSFVKNPSISDEASSTPSSNRMAQKVLESFQHSSRSEYMKLFPTLEDFYELMQEHSGVYGNNLNEAKKEFASTYTEKVVPALNASFDRIVREGEERGISWKAIHYAHVEQDEVSQHAFTTAPVTITFYSEGKEHRLRIEKALMVKGQWRVSQFVKFI